MKLYFCGLLSSELKHYFRFIGWTTEFVLANFDVDMAMVRQIQNGDDGEFVKILTKYSNLINSISRKYSIDGYDESDMAQLVRISIWKSVIAFDEKKMANRPFLFCLSKIIKKEINQNITDILRSSLAKKRTGDVVEFFEDEYPVESDFCEYEYNQLFTGKHSVIFKMLRIGYTQREIAALLGKSLRTVNKNIIKMRELAAI